MNMQSAKYGDLVLVDIKGKRFHAELHDLLPDGKWRIMPLSSHYTHHTCTSRNIKKLWRASRRGT